MKYLVFLVLLSASTAACATLLNVDIDGKPRPSQNDLDGSADGATNGAGDASSEAADSNGVDRDWTAWSIRGGDAFPSRYSSDGEVVYDSDTQLGWPVAALASPIAWDHAEEACSALRVDGFDDWRVPTRIELISIVAYGLHPTTKSYFDTESDLYWTATTYVDDPSKVWTIDFTLGEVTWSARDEAHRLRCVRGGRTGVQNGPDQRFTPGVGTVFDEQTNLVWQKESVAARTFLDARAYCKALSINGTGGFDVPFAHELFTIVDDRRSNPALPSPFTMTGDGRVWSRTAYDAAGEWILSVTETLGGTFHQNQTDQVGVRCVHR